MGDTGARLQPLEPPPCTARPLPWASPGHLLLPLGLGVSLTHPNLLHPLNASPRHPALTCPTPQSLPRPPTPRLPQPSQAPSPGNVPHI